MFAIPEGEIMKSTHLAAALALGMSGTAQANIDIQFDFTYDTGSFFASADRLAALNAAASVFETRFADTLSAIVSSGSNSFDTVFFNPSNPNTNITLDSASIAADVVRVYVGATNLGGSTLGVGGPGGFQCSGFGSFCADASNRGEGDVSGSDAVDFAPWGGAMSFNSTISWHFGLTPKGLESGESDFYSVALHELAHVLGFGTSDSFDRYVDGSFYGPAAMAVHGGAVPMANDGAHWFDGTRSVVNGVSQEAAMDPTIRFGTRKNFTDLDYAAMRDVGWEVTPVPEAETWAMMLAGLGLVGVAAARRRSR